MDCYRLGRSKIVMNRAGWSIIAIAGLCLTGAIRASEPVKVSVYTKNPRTTPIREWRELPPVDGSGELRNSAFRVFRGGSISPVDPNDPGGLQRVTGATPVTAGKTGLRYLPQEAGWVAVNAFYHLNRANGYYRSLGVTALDNYPLPIYLQVKGLEQNLYGLYSGADPEDPGYLMFGVGANGRDAALDSDTLLHEYTHYVHWQLNRSLINQYSDGGVENTALIEAFADYFPASFADEACVLDYLSAVLVSRGPCHRSLSNRRRYPDDVGPRSGTGASARHAGWIDVHDLSELFSGALWDLRGAIGREKTDRLFVRLMTQLSGPATFTDARAMLIQVDDQVFSGEHRSAIERVFDHRGISSQAHSYLTANVFNKNASTLQVAFGPPSDDQNPLNALSSTFVAGRSYPFSGKSLDPQTESLRVEFLDSQGQLVPGLTRTSRRTFNFTLKFLPEHVGQVKSLSLTLSKPGESRTAVVPVKIVPERGPMEPLSPEPVRPSIRPHGDVNGNAKLTMEDVVLGLRRIVGLEPWGDEISLDLGRTWPSGTTGDDEQTLGDLTLLLRKVVRE